MAKGDRTEVGAKPECSAAGQTGSGVDEVGGPLRKWRLAMASTLVGDADGDAGGEADFINRGRGVSGRDGCGDGLVRSLRRPDWRVRCLAVSTVKMCSRCLRSLLRLEFRMRRRPMVRVSAGAGRDAR